MLDMLEVEEVMAVARTGRRREGAGLVSTLVAALRSQTPVCVVLRSRSV